MGGWGGTFRVLNVHLRRLVRYIGSTFRLSNFVNNGTPYSNIVPMRFLLLNNFH